MKKIKGNNGKFTVITSTGLIDSVKLKTVLNDSNKTDTDLDGLYDWDEVNVEIINKHLKNEGKQELKTVNNSDLPLFSDLILHSSEWGSFKPYLWSESDFARYAYANCFDNVRILPIVSDPSKADSDGDGIVDCMKYFDSDAYQHNVNKEKYKITEFNDPNPLKFEYLWEWPTVSADAVENVDGNIQSKVDINGNNLVFKDENKLTRLQASFKDNRNHKAIDISTGGGFYYVIAAYDGVVSYTFDGCYHLSSASENSKDYKKCYCNPGYYQGFGNCVEITSTINGTEYKSLYSHLKQNSLTVEKGETVKAGDIIVIVGSSGKAFGAHLDFSIYSRQSEGKVCYDSILFDDLYIGKDYYQNGDGSNVSNSYKNMLMNIPKNIKNVCTGGNGGCSDCKVY